jgi:hypothetical protein
MGDMPQMWVIAPTQFSGGENSDSSSRQKNRGRISRLPKARDAESTLHPLNERNGMERWRGGRKRHGEDDIVVTLVSPPST